jgi:hypothetical protein
MNGQSDIFIAPSFVTVGFIGIPRPVSYRNSKERIGEYANSCRVTNRGRLGISTLQCDIRKRLWPQL